MQTRVRLLIRRVMSFGFTWDDLESYLTQKKSTLSEELKEFFKGYPDSDERVNYIFKKIDSNERIRAEMD